MFEKFLITKHGHPGSVFSMMEIAVTLFYGGFVRFDDKKSFKDKVLISKRSCNICSISNFKRLWDYFKKRLG